MKHSITYYLTILIIKLKGLKKDFSQDPIDHKKIRKEDVHIPKGQFYKQDIVSRFDILGTTITEIKKNGPSNNLLIFIHGGAFISGPAQHHWDAIKDIHFHTNHNIWMCDYPKAPENKIDTITENIDAVYQEAIKNYKAKNIILIGDSVGATLITTLAQRLILANKETPKKIILVSPVMDATMSNPDIDIVDQKDPMLSRAGILSAKKMCAGSKSLSDQIMSPLHGSFHQFPDTILYIASNDITYPDQKLAVSKMKEAQVNLTLIEGQDMPHVWPFLPVMKEAKVSLKDIIKEINS